MIIPTKISEAPQGTNITPERAEVSPFSLASKWLLLQQSGGWFRLHDGIEGKYIRMLPSDVNTSSRPRWSRVEPAILSYIMWNRLYSFNVVTGASTMLREFTEYIKVDAQGRNGIDDKGEADANGNLRVLAGKLPNGTEEVFTFDVVTLVKGLVSPLPSDVDGLKLSPDKKIIVSRPPGIFVWEHNYRIVPRNAHACPCTYKGRPHLAWFNGDRNLVLVDIETSKQVLVPFPVDSSIYVAHVSSCDKPILVISMSAPANNAPCQIVRISLDDLSAEVLCEPKMVYRDSDSQPNASLSRDGSRVVFRVDDGQQRSAWMLKLDKVDTLPDKVDSATRIETRIDYSQFVGKSEFVLVPRPDGAVDVIERKLR